MSRRHAERPAQNGQARHSEVKRQAKKSRGLMVDHRRGRGSARSGPAPAATPTAMITGSVRKAARSGRICTEPVITPVAATHRTDDHRDPRLCRCDHFATARAEAILTGRIVLPAVDHAPQAHPAPAPTPTTSSFRAATNGRSCRPRCCSHRPSWRRSSCTTAGTSAPRILLGIDIPLIVIAAVCAATSLDNQLPAARSRRRPRQACAGCDRGREGAHLSGPGRGRCGRGRATVGAP